MNELALYAGAGGGILGGLLCGFRTVAAVEIDRHARSTLLQRQRDGVLAKFPIWDDARTFNGVPFRGLVSVVSAGFPCQPFSFAGKQKAEADERNGWPDTIRIIRDVRPAIAFLENVPGLLSQRHGYFGTVLGDLAAAGFNAEWGVLGASDVGARHRRKRLWILAYSVRNGAREVLAQLAGQAEQAEIGARRRLRSQSGNGGDDVADTERQQSRQRCRPAMLGRRTGETEQTRLGSGDDATDSYGQRFSRGPQRDCEPIELGVESSRGDDFGGLRHDVPNSDGEFLRQQLGRRESGASEAIASNDGEAATRRAAQPRLGGMADGLADRLDAPWFCEPGDLPRVAANVPDRVGRLRAIGNGQVPLCAAIAFEQLRQRVSEVLK